MSGWITSAKPSAHAAIIALVCVASILLGVVLTDLFGKGFSAAAPSQKIPSIGRIEYLRMPANARKLEDIKSFVIHMDRGDDYVRVFVNNYVMIDNEGLDPIFYADTDGGAQHPIDNSNLLNEINTHVVRRTNVRLGNVDVRLHLTSGKNYIVAELENAYLGCHADISISVNGVDLERFPKFLSDRHYAEDEQLNETLKRQMEKLLPSALRDSLCSRRVWEFDLDE